MKKILTVSLFAMMAVSAANAEIASTTYVTDRTGTVSFTADGATKGKTNLTEAIAAVDAQLQSTSNTLTGDITGSINELERDITAMDTAYKAADTALDNRVDTLESDNTTNKSNITSLQTAVNNLNTGTNSVSSQITAALDDYSTTTEMNTAIAGNAVNTVVSGTANGTIAVDGEDVAVKGLGSAAYTASTDYDAAGSAATAQTAAIAAAKSETTTQVDALANGAVKTNTDDISTITTNLGGLNGITIPAACQSGRCALVMNAGKAEWETINY